jgi:hypothetical protein
MIDNVAGMMSAPPIPMNARVEINWPEVAAIAEAIEPIPKRMKPI